MENTEFAGGVGYLLTHVGSALGRQLDQVLLERLGIGMSQFRILSVLEENPGIAQRKLGDRLGQTEASISRQTKLLLEKAMVTAVVNPASKREHAIALTPKGGKLLLAARDTLSAHYAAMLDSLSAKQQKQLLELLAQVHAHACDPDKPYACDHFQKH